MHRDIIVSAFAKAKKEAFEEHGIQVSTNKAAERISDFISENSKVPFGAKSLRLLHNKTKDTSESVEVKQPQVVVALCNYLAYDSYEAYALSKKGRQEMFPKSAAPLIPKSFISMHKWPLSIFLFILTGSGIYFMTTKQRWMIWDQTHYIEVPFDAEALQNGRLKLLKKDRIESFKKVDLTCKDVLFNPDESARFWYGKNAKKELEYFNDLGLHPETGKTLKPLSKYMIEKYICVD
jgi:hypothetical protein